MRKLVLLVLVAGAAALGQPNNYAEANSWLCRPGRHDACDVDHTTTLIASNGTLTIEKWRANARAAIDCFYVYPTVSTDPTPNSDMIADAAELNVIRQQFARFGAKCRTYAPLYRQVTLLGLGSVLNGIGSLERGLQYDDVRDAWNYYLDHDNQGRGFMLLGHSQGSFILRRLIREEIDGKPVQARMISAVLLGTNVVVPRGKDIGGEFQHTPLCHSSSQTGCIITYSSFRSTAPPPANTLFGKVPDKEMMAACTNPAALEGGSGELHAYFSTDGSTIGRTTTPRRWMVSGKRVDTPWVSVPGLLSAKCVSDPNGTYLEVTIHNASESPRVSDIPGDLYRDGQLLANWGLHLVDFNLAMGNLLEIVDQQSKAWLAKSRTRKS